MFCRNTAVSSVHQELKFVGWESGKLLEIRSLLRTGLKPPILVFVNSKERAQQLFMELIYDDVIIDVIHGDRTQLQVFFEKKIEYVEKKVCIKIAKKKYLLMFLDIFTLKLTKCRLVIKLLG